MVLWCSGLHCSAAQRSAVAVLQCGKTVVVAQPSQAAHVISTAIFI